LNNIFLSIFSNYSPDAFGLCGEAYLWEDFRTCCMALPPMDNEEEFVSRLQGVFRTLTGVPVESKSFVFLERYNCGGFSSGMVDPWNWLSVIIPEMTTRFRMSRGAFGKDAGTAVVYPASMEFAVN
jgi:hypothetical protein